MNELTAKDLRKTEIKSNTTQKEKCYICHKHETITQLHHVVPLRDCARWINTGYIERVDVPCVWLCPNCHSYIHRLMRKYNFYELMQIYTDEEYKRVTALLKIKDEIETMLCKQIEQHEGL